MTAVQARVALDKPWVTRMLSRFLATRHWHMPALSILASILLMSNCGSRLQPASANVIDQAEARWQAHSLTDYRIVVDVQRPEAEDSFRATVQVEGGRIVGGSLRYREKGGWGVEQALSETQAFPYTVPGLFHVLRAEVANSGRRTIEVEFDEEYALPRRVVLGPVYEDRQAVHGTETTLRVYDFDLLDDQE